MSYWQDKVALVTGGSAGLGRAIAETLARRGAKVVIAGRSEDRLTRAAAEMQRGGCEVTPIAADITDQHQVDALVGETVAKHGRLDLLVNNAGRSMRSEVTETTPDDFRDLLELNFLAVVRCTRAAVKHLVESKGHLVNIGSLAAKTVSPYSSAYTASKFALAGYTHQLRFEGPPEVHVLLVCPGPIAREDAGGRYDDQAGDLPEHARQPGGGAKLKGIDANKLAKRILVACEKRKPELVMPRKTRVLFAVSQLWPSFGDWILRRFTK